MNIMKTYKYILSVVLFVAAVIGCTKDELGEIDFVDTVVAPTNVTALFSVTQDNTGTVTIAPNSEGAISYDIDLGDETSETLKVAQGKSATHVYTEGNYDVKIVATGITGLKTEATLPLVVSFKAPENLVAEILNDAAVSKKVNVTVNADYATSFDVYFGEEGNDEPVPANIGETASYTYLEPGTYTIKIVAKGAAIETAEYTEEFEVTAIVQPLESAATPPDRISTDYLSIFTSVYDDVPNTNYFPDWGQGSQGSSWAMFNLGDDEMLQYIKLSYQGITLGETIDVSEMEYLHMDVWTSDLPQIKTSLINGVDGNSTEEEIARDLTIDKWTSIDIPISEYVDLGLSVDQIFQLKFVGEPWASGTVFIDNIYFWKKPTEEVKALLYDDFEGNGNITTWDGDDCGMDNNYANPYVDINNESATVLRYGDTGGTYANVRFDAPTKFDLASDSKFSLKIYVESSSVSGDQPKQISLKLQDGTAGEPWVLQTEIIKPIVFDQWQTVTFDFATDATLGQPDPLSRTDFDRVVLQINSEGNNDTVTAYIDDFSYGIASATPPFDGGLVTNGDFENGAEPWTIGVGTDPVPLGTDAGNTYYSVNVEKAGNVYDVNMSQKLEIIQGSTYTLSFDAWSDRDRTIDTGIGLSAGPWTNKAEVVNITASKQTFTLTLEAADFGATDARVIFDVGGAVGAVNIDNVSLFINN
jgi:hypothetical protein